jgi:hypothetical protein
MGDELGHADICQQANTDARAMTVAGETEDRNPHPEGLAGRSRAVVGKGVEGEIDAIVALKVGKRRLLMRAQFQAIGGDTGVAKKGS